MKRRSFFQSATAISLAATGGGLFGQDVYDAPTRTTVPESAEQTLIDIQASTHYLHTLQRTRSSKLEHKVFILNADGNINGNWTDVNCFAPRMATSPDGTTVVLFARPETKSVVSCVVLSPEGAVLDKKETLLPRLPLSFAVIGKTMVGYHEDGTMSLAPLSGEGEMRALNGVLLPVGISGHLAPSSLVSVLPTGDGAAIPLDLTSARFSVLDVSAGRCSSYGVIKHPSIDRALDNATNFVARNESVAVGAKFPTPLAISAASADGLGNVVCAPAPISPTGPLCLMLDKAGVAGKQFKCSFPDRSNAADRVLFHLALGPNRLSLGFRDGDLISYNI